MAAEGLFPRKATGKHDQDILQITATIEPAVSARPGKHCSHCGLEAEDHQSPIKTDSNPAAPPICEVVMQLPTTDLSHLFSASFHSNSSQGQVDSYLNPRKPWRSTKSLVAMSDPDLTQAIREAVVALKLKSFRTTRRLPTSGLPLFPLDEKGSDMVEIQNQIAPYALLSVLTKVFIGVLVRGGISIADQDRVRAGRRKIRIQLLTPSHILRGLRRQAHNESHHLVLSRLGVPLNAIGPVDVKGSLKTKVENDSADAWEFPPNLDQRMNSDHDHI
jgi:hypothetical protein